MLSLALLLVWTVFWLVAAGKGVLVDTSLGRGEFEGGLGFYQVWEFAFVTAVYVVRWLPGALLLSIPTLVEVGARLVGRIRARRVVPGGGTA